MSAVAVLNAVVTKLSAGTLVNRVMIGMPKLPESPPRVYLEVEGIRSDHDDDFGAYRRTITIRALGFVGATSNTAAARQLPALSLADTIATAIEADRHLAGTVVDVKLDAMAIDGELINHAGLGVAEVLIEAWWIARSGEGM